MKARLCLIAGLLGLPAIISCNGSPASPPTEPAADVSHIIVNGLDPDDVVPVAFGAVELGDDRHLSVSIANPGWTTGTLSGEISMAAGSDFAIADGGGAFSLQPGQSHDVLLRFAPTLPLERTGTLFVSHNASHGSYVGMVRTLAVPLSGVGVAALNAPVPLMPAHEDTGVATNPTTFTWDPVQGANSYSLEISTSPSFFPITMRIPEILATYHQVSGLAGATTYYWRINAASAANDSGPYSETHRFTTATPAPGTQWTTRTSGTTNTLRSVAWAPSVGGSGLFVAVGDNGTILTSPDGVAWSPQVSNTGNTLYGVTWTGSRFIAVGGSSSSGTVVSSLDGMTWEAINVSSTLTLRSVAWTGYEIVAVGGGFVGSVVVSTDGGTTWSTRIVDALTLQSVASTNVPDGFSAAVGADGSIITSPTTASWDARPSGTSNNLWGIAWSGSQFAVVGDSGTVLTSPDGTAWTNRNSGTTTALGGITWWNDRFVAVGLAGIVTQSLDGITWNASSSGNVNSLGSVAGSPSRLVAVGYGGTIITSP